MFTLSKNPTPDEIKALADLPFGQAERVLKENNMWNYEQDPDFSKFEIDVVAEVTAEAYTTVTVYASDEAHARELVQQMATTRF